MAYTTQYSGYVKFLRGTPAAYAAITKNDDTLYFISEDNAASGKLYLGNKLISGSTSVATTLGDLSDVLISAGVTSNSLLVYDGVQEKWVSKTLAETFDLTIADMIGATASTNGVAGYVPAPQAGEQNLYLRGDATWANPTAAVELSISNLSSNLSAVTSDLLSLRGNDTGNVTIREIALEEVAKVVANAPSSFDTLKEIANWISDHEDALDLAEIKSDISDLQAVVFDTIEETDPQTGEIITPASDGLVTRVGDLEDALFITNSNVSNLQSVTSTLSTDVAGLQTRMTAAETTISNHTTAINDMDQRLRWQDLISDNT